MEDTKVTTMGEFVKKHDLRFTCRWVPSRPDGLMSDSPRHFNCRIYRGPIHPNSHSFGLYFSQGSAHTEFPTLVDVLDCVANDASGYDSTKDFEDWASDYEYDTDSRSAEKTYRAVKRQSEQLKRTLGEDAYAELLYDIERL